jgi:hypothetical protein
MFRLFRRDREKGAVLVEFALILPIFLMLIFGIVEASWAFAQASDVRHGVREGARLAAVDFGNAPAIGAQMCDRMDLKTDPSRVTIRFHTFNGPGERGNSASLRVEHKYDSLTGFLDPIFQDTVISSDIEFRVERPVAGQGPAQWWGDGGVITCS